MKGKHVAILLALVALIGGAGLFMLKRTQSDWQETGTGSGGKVLEFDLNNVAQVSMKTAATSINLVKKGDDWTVQERADYPADFVKVSQLLRKFWDMKTVQEVKAGPSQFSRLELVEPGKGDGSGTLVEFKDKDGKSLAGVILGKPYVKKSEGGPMDMGGMPSGRYLMPAGSNKVSLVSETLSEFEVKPEPWLNHDFIKVENPKSITLAGLTDAQKWSITRDNATAPWVLTDAKPEEKFDPAKATPTAGALTSPTFKDVLAPDAKPEETGLDKPTLVTLTTVDNFTYTLKIGKANDVGYPVMVAVTADLAKERKPGADEKPEDATKLNDEFKANLKKLEDKLAAEQKFQQRPYVLEKSTVDSLLKDRSTLMADSKPAEPPAPGGAPAGLPNGVPPPAPGATATTPPVSAPSASTPPVAVPPSGKPAATGNKKKK